MGSSQSITTGFLYYGGIVQAICYGPVTRLTKVRNGDTVIWTGDIDQTSRDSDGKTTLSTELGSLDFYWGRSDQNPSSILAAALIDYGSGPTTVPIPAWRNLCYVVGQDIAFGTQTTPPTLRFEYERKLDLLTLSAHDVSGDALIPEVIYDVFTNAFALAGLDPALIDTQSFVDACETLILEGIGVSPFLDETRSVRDFVGTLLTYIDAFLYREQGIIKIKLIRKESTSGIPTLDEDAMTEEPQITNEGWDETWNFTRLIFNDRENNWDENAVEPWDDQANAAIVGEMVPKDVELSYVTRRAVAKILAKRKGIQGGIPQVRFKLSLLPSYSTLRPGDLVFVSNAKLNVSNKLARIHDVEVKNSGAGVEVVAFSENTRVETNDYVPPADDIFNISAFYDKNGLVADGNTDISGRLLWLPSGQKGSRTDGFLCAFARNAVTTTNFQLWWTWDPNQKPYKKIESGKNFAIEATLLAWHRVRNNTRWLLRVQFADQDDADFVAELFQDNEDFMAITGRRVYKQTGSVINEHQTDGHWTEPDTAGLMTPVSTLIYDIEVSDAAFSSQGFALETTAGQGSYPTATIYFGRDKDFVIKTPKDIYFERDSGNAQLVLLDGVVTNPDTDKKRWFKLLAMSNKEKQALADVTAFTFDRNDTAMSANGTYSRQWGNVVPTLYEAFDVSAGSIAFSGVSPYDSYVADYDTNLYAAMFGLTNSDQNFLLESVEEVLAYMAIVGVQFYNKTS